MAGDLEELPEGQEFLRALTETNPRSRDQLLKAFADNTTGDIKAKDFRDLVSTIMHDEFRTVHDFWKEPCPRYEMEDLSARGWIDYSCLIDQDDLAYPTYAASDNVMTHFGMAMNLSPSGTWRPADLLNSDRCVVHGLALGSYPASASFARILRRGLIYASKWSARFYGAVGDLVYLHSRHPVILNSAGGSWSVTPMSDGARRERVAILGYVEHPLKPYLMSGDSVVGASAYKLGIWRFDPVWAITGS